MFKRNRIADGLATIALHQRPAMPLSAASPYVLLRVYFVQRNALEYEHFFETRQ
jgi:hypothetical protein